jgi:hypothetical protein
MIKPSSIASKLKIPSPTFTKTAAGLNDEYQQ